ncbi:hypothetical protein ACO2Q4_21735 [Paracoccus sp. KR1-242]
MVNQAATIMSFSASDQFSDVMCVRLGREHPAVTGKVDPTPKLGECSISVPSTWLGTEIELDEVSQNYLAKTYRYAHFTENGSGNSFGEFGEWRTKFAPNGSSSVKRRTAITLENNEKIGVPPCEEIGFAKPSGGGGVHKETFPRLPTSS